MSDFASAYLEKDIQIISIKLNLIKDDHEKMKKSLLSDGLLLKNQNRNHCLSSVIYNICLIDEGGLVPNTWKAYIKDCLRKEECEYLSVTLKNLIDQKSDVQRQLSKISKDPFWSVDLISCSAPIPFIKAYLSN